MGIKEVEERKKKKRKKGCRSALGKVFFFSFSLKENKRGERRRGKGRRGSNDNNK